MHDDWIEINAEWKGGDSFVGKNQAGGIVQMGLLDEKPGVGPMQLLLVALAGCTGIDIISILRKKRIDLIDLKIEVRGRRAEDFPMVWEEIEIIYKLWGSNLKTKDIEQAIMLSEKKYCSVGIMLEKTAKITSSYELHSPDKNNES